MKIYWATEPSFEKALSKLQQTKTLMPFSSEVYQFAAKLSKKFLLERAHPEIVALGYWLRKANLLRMQDQFNMDNKGTIKLARGTVFHISPSNVDTIFVYSWLLSLLAGNRNVIRLSSKSENNVLLKTIISLFESGEFSNIAERTILCTYNHNEGFTEVISNICHTRVIWGGDSTVQTIRAIPLAPLANELVFPDRFSVALINSEALNDAESVVQDFYNDAYWFDQMACSSPRLIFWLGNNREGIELFWNSLESLVKQKYELQPALQVAKYTTALQLTTLPYTKQMHQQPFFTRIEIEKATKMQRNEHCGAGLFLECHVSKMEEIAEQLIDKDQTLSYFGVEKSDLESLIRILSNRSLDRIVPIGQALDFNSTWDGQQFLTSFTREVVLM